MVDLFSKMIHFVLSDKKMDTSHVDIYFKEVDCFHGVPKTIGLDRNVKILSNF